MHITEHVVEDECPNCNEYSRVDAIRDWETNTLSWDCPQCDYEVNRWVEEYYD